MYISFCFAAAVPHREEKTAGESEQYRCPIRCEKGCARSGNRHFAPHCFRGLRVPRKTPACRRSRWVRHGAASSNARPAIPAIPEDTALQLPHQNSPAYFRCPNGDSAWPRFRAGQWFALLSEAPAGYSLKSSSSMSWAGRSGHGRYRCGQRAGRPAFPAFCSAPPGERWASGRKEAAWRRCRR